MAIAHVCTTCGLDLARHRAAIDPIYHLPLVICSRCSTACVRRRHPIQARIRFLRRLALTLLSMAGRTALLALFTVVTLASAYWMGRLVSHSSPNKFFGFEYLTIIVCGVLIPILTGAWLQAAFRHWPRLLQWPAWAAWCVNLGWLMPLLVERIIAHEWKIWTTSPMLSAPAMHGLLFFFCMLLVSLAGIPIGTLMTKMCMINRRQRWMRLRRRTRNRRRR